MAIGTNEAGVSKRRAILPEGTGPCAVGCCTPGGTEIPLETRLGCAVVGWLGTDGHGAFVALEPRGAEAWLLAFISQGTPSFGDR